MRAVTHDDGYLIEVAEALGSREVAERAIAERDRRVAAGEDVVVLWYAGEGVLRVGPAAPVVGRSNGR